MSRIIEPQQAQRDLVPEGSAIAKAPDYSLKRWVALARYADDWRCTYRQQLGREPNSAVGTWAFKLAVRRLAALWQARGGDHEPDSIGAHEWA